MARQRVRKLRNVIIGVFKDKASLAKAVVVSGGSSTRAVVLRATTHHPASSPPSERRVAALLGLGGQGGATRRASSACVSALMDRLTRTRSAAVALKCLVVAHRAAARGSFILRDQLSFCPASGGRNFLNLSTFRDESDERAWQLSAWVRWFAAAVEQSLTVSRVIGYYLSPETAGAGELRQKAPSLPSSELLAELDALVGYVERARDAPDSVFDLQKNDLVYEVLRLVREDYRLVQREILARVRELGDRIFDGNDNDLRSGELTRVLTGLKRLEDCKERLVSMFLKKRRDDEFWDEIGLLKMKVLEIMDIRLLLLTDHDHDRVDNLDYQRIKGSDSRFLNNPFVEPSQWLMLPSSNGGWSRFGVTSLSVGGMYS